MDTKPLLYGLIGFFIGGLLVSVAATTFEKERLAENVSATSTHSVESLRSKTGDDFDKAFIEGMIEHHQGAVEMAQLADGRARHDEIKQLSREIIAAQESEITEMKQWQKDWGYSSKSAPAGHGAGH